MRELWRRLWSRIRPEERRSQHTDGVTLTADQFNAASSGVLEELRAIDTLSPAGPVLPTWIPTEVEMQLWIKAYLQDCPEMFDEGTLDFLTPYLRSQEQLWLRASAVAEMPRSPRPIGSGLSTTDTSRSPAPGWPTCPTPRPSSRAPSPTSTVGSTRKESPTMDDQTTPDVNDDLGHPTRRRSPLRDFTHRDPWWLPWSVFLVLLAIASVADFYLIRTLLLHVLPGENPVDIFTVHNMVAAAVVALSTAAMFGAGISKAHFDESQAEEAVNSKRVQVELILVVSAWAVLGIGLVVVRILAARYQLASENVAAEYLLTVLMSAVYVATGTLAFVDGSVVARPYGTRVRHARRHLARLQEEHRATQSTRAEVIGQIRRHEEVAASPGTDPDLIRADYLVQRESIKELGDALRRFAQIEIARRVGSEEAAEAAADGATYDGATRAMEGGGTDAGPAAAAAG